MLIGCVQDTCMYVVLVQPNFIIGMTTTEFDNCCVYHAFDKISSIKQNVRANEEEEKKEQKFINNWIRDD